MFLSARNRTKGDLVKAKNTCEWTLWGSHERYADGTVIKISGGSLRECRTEQRRRVSDGGWLLGIYARGEAPTGLREQVQALASMRAASN